LCGTKKGGRESRTERGVIAYGIGMRKSLHARAEKKEGENNTDASSLGLGIAGKGGKSRRGMGKVGGNYHFVINKNYHIEKNGRSRSEEGVDARTTKI